MKKVLSLLLFLSAALFSFAQEITLTGTVRDGDSDSPLPGVRVVLDSTGGALTNANGVFTLKVQPGRHHLDFVLSLYEPESRDLLLKAGEQPEALEIVLTEEGSQLRTVVISASQYEKNLAEETVSMDVIDKDLFKNNNATELGEAVDKSVGVQVQDGQITIRGGSAFSYGVGTRTAVLVDNLSFTSADLGDAQLKQAPLENTEQVEIIKGASSVIYGSSALNGVVNVITGWPTEKEKTTVTFFAGFYDYPKFDYLQWWDSIGVRNFNGMFFNHQRKYKNWDVIIGGNMNNVTSFLEEANENRYRLNMKTRYRHPNVKGLSFGLNANAMRENSGRFFLPLDVDSNAYRILDGSPDRYWRFNIDPHLTYLTEGGIKHRVLGRYLHVFRKGNSGDPNASSHNLSLDYQFQKRWGTMWTLTAGLPVNYGFSTSNLYPGQRQTSSGAGYVQGDFKKGRFSAVGGFRYEYTAVDTVTEFTKPVFRTGINYRAGKATYLRASWGQAYRLPSIGERFITADFAAYQIFPNPQLLAESGWSLDMGVKQGVKIGKWLGFLDLSTFLSEYDNFVEYRLGFFPPDSVQNPNPFDWLGLKPFNVDLSRVFGYEVSIYGKGMIGPVEVRTLAGYTYSYAGDLTNDTTQQNLGNFMGNAFDYMFTRLEEDPSFYDNLITAQSTLPVMNFRTRHLVKGDIEFFYKRFSAGYTAFYGSFPERVDPLYFLAIPGLEQYVQDHQKGDFVMGVRAAYNVPDKVKVAFIVKNLTNHHYASRPGKFDPPRNYTLQLNFFL